MAAEEEETHPNDIDSQDITDSGEEPEELFTPNGTPLPRGPPPPQTVQAWRPMSHAISSAVANELAFRGIHVRRSLALITGDISTMTSIRIDVQWLARSHPNTLHFDQLNEEGEEEEAVEEAAEEEATTVDAGAGAVDTALDTSGPTEREAALTRTIVEAMERDGRQTMTAEEEASLMHDPALRDVINSLDTEERAAIRWGPPTTPTTTAVSGTAGSGGYSSGTKYSTKLHGSRSRWCNGKAEGPKEVGASFDGHSRAVLYLHNLEYLCANLTWNATGVFSGNIAQAVSVQPAQVCLGESSASFTICPLADGGDPETKWAEDNCWSSADFHFIHSAGRGKLDKVGGLLTIVSTRLARRDDIQYQGVHPGRLLHVRVQTGKTPLDILNVYQYAANDKPDTPEYRHKFLLCLQRCLSSLPRRHALILSGDFNSTCSPMPKVCGPHVLPVVESHKSDYMDLLHLCEAQSLVVLNSWRAPSDDHTLATFTFGKLRSQIDYVMVRQSMATAEARKAGVIHNYPVASWREGANHHAVEATLPLPRPHWLSRPKPPVVHQIDVQRMITDLRAATQTTALKAFREEVAESVQPDLHMIDDVVLQAALKYYPKRAQKFTAKGIMEAWKLWAQFAKAHKIYKQRARVRSKVRRDEFLQQAQQAADKGNSHEMWCVIKRLAPKSRHKKVQLYKHGHLMTPTAELDWIAEAFGERFGAPFSSEPGALLRQHAPVQLQADHVLEELSRIPVRKAVPPGAVPAIAWRACAEQIVQPLVRKVNADWREDQVQVHQDWAKADVALLPKGKPNASSPLDLRPIGLQHPIGKTIMKVVLSMAKEEMVTMVRKWPQTAYLPGRRSLHDKYDGINELLLQWLRQVIYVFHHGRDSRSAFDVQLRESWSGEHAVLYADDSHLRWQFCTFMGLEKSIAELRTILKIFARFGMKVNEKKTQALLMVTGSDKGKVHKHYVRTGHEGKRLLLSPKDPTRWLPLVTQAPYLGLILSYDRFEALSTRHRISKANQRRWALAPVIHSRRLGVKYKLQVWRSCVQSTLLYGLHAFGLTPKLMHEIQVTAMKHIRAVVSDPRHVTGHTHQEVLEKYKLEDMHTLIGRAHDRERADGGDPDWMALPEWDDHITQCLQEVAVATSGQDPDSEPENWACPECDSFFNSAAALKIHARRAHGIHNKPLRIFDRARHALKGLPTCRFCERRFARWQTLEQHINALACPNMLVDQKVDEHGQSLMEVRMPSLDPEVEAETEDGCEIVADSALNTEIPESRPLAQQLLVQQTAQQGLRFFIQQPQITRQLHQHCGICGQWVASQKVMKLHYRNTHPEIFPARQGDISRIIELSATPSIRCHYCGSSPKDWKAHMYKCTTIWQCAVLCLPQEIDRGLSYVRESRPRLGDGRILWGGEKRRNMQAGAMDQEINLLKQDTSLVLWFSPGGDSILGHLYRTAVEFKKKQAAEPTWGMAHMPLKQVMALSMFRELKDRHHRVLNTKELLQRAVEMGWRDTQGWHFQQWNPKLRHLELDKSRPQISDVDMSNKLELLTEHVKRDAVHRFHCTRRLTETMDSKATFKLDLSVRNKHAEEIWDVLIELQGCCVFQLIGLGYRKERLGKGPLCQKIQEQLRY
ncbi:MCAT [Symbiodinium sp. CCMP2592]|nr:MCAT [Symbiodinium sp. CCMP2592]